MNLKESYRYANFLDNLLVTAYEYLNNKGFVTTTKQEHLRSKTNPDAVDETLDLPKPYDVDFTPNQVIDFVEKILEEKENLMASISVAKASVEINIDNAIAMNKKKQGFASVLNRLANQKPSENILSGSAYRFNINNEQVRYYYDIKSVTSIDFNRNDVKGIIKKIQKETDEISAKLDLIEVNTEVVFNPKWDVNDEFEDIVVSM